jgi:hypothetical protein
MGLVPMSPKTTPTARRARAGVLFCLVSRRLRETMVLSSKEVVRDYGKRTADGWGVGKIGATVA